MAPLVRTWPSLHPSFAPFSAYHNPVFPFNLQYLYPQNTQPFLFFFPSLAPICLSFIRSLPLSLPSLCCQDCTSRPDRRHTPRTHSLSFTLTYRHCLQFPPLALSFFFLLMSYKSFAFGLHLRNKFRNNSPVPVRVLSIASLLPSSFIYL